MRHGCYDRAQFKDSLDVQDGWTPDGRRVMKTIPFRMAEQCMYDLRREDEQCKGCKHAQTS